MTTNAVNYWNNQQKLAVDREIAALDRKVDFDKLGISKDELLEKIRQNQVNEYLKDKEVSANDRNGFMTGLGSILRGISPIAGAIAGAVNDESWHNKLTMAYDQATALPFSEKAGNPNNLEKACFTNLNSLINFSPSAHMNSGIVSITYIPTIAVTDMEVESSELQNNVRILFTKVRSSNSGNVNNYDQSDLFQFTLCSSSVFEMLRLLVRPLNYLNAVRKPMNALTAWDKHILTVMCGNASNAEFIIQNRTDIIQAINSCIRSANAQILPIGFDLTKRRSLLNGRIFTHKGNRDEIYIFTPACYYVYDEANALAKCKVFDPATVFSSIATIRQVLNDMLTPLINGTATNIMAGDMAKAYPRQSAIIREVPYVTKGDIYSEDENILNAFMNATVVDVAVTNQLDIKQGVNAALDTYIYQGNLNALTKKCTLDISTQHVLDSTSELWRDFTDQYEGTSDETKLYQNYMNVKVDAPTKYDIMSSTRFKVSYEYEIKYAQDDQEEIYYFNDGKVFQWGSEIINYYVVKGFNKSADFTTNTLVNYKYGTAPTIDDYRPMSIYQSLGLVNLYDRFHYLPSMFNKIYDNIPDNELTEFSLVHSYYNIRLLKDEELMHLHNASFGSLISIKLDSSDNIE